MSVLDLAHAVCPDCGTGFMDFRKSGRLGCAHDYTLFRVGLIPLLKRVHDASQHRGKTPQSSVRDRKISDEVRQLRRRLQLALAADRFEEATTLRDQIRMRDSSI